MTFNTKKCKTMHLGNKPNSEYYLKDSENKIHKIEQITEEKDLGVIFDNKLTFSKHINTKVNIANRNLGLIIKKFIYMNKEMFLQLYKSLVRPHLEYASVIWTPRYKKDVIAIENVQRRATRVLQELQGLEYKDRLIRLGLPTLEYRRARADVIEVYKLGHGLDKISINILSPRDNSNTRGNTHKLYKPRARINMRKNSFSHRVVDTWNSLSTDTIEAQTLNCFKSRLNKNWKDQSKFIAQCYNPNY